ncbi:MAG TPA: hypothetical protein VN454_07400 [Candidatus Angelobacter sp.]|nr:hypothetical protein [Candidatus Angelobacter sp.]
MARHPLFWLVCRGMSHAGTGTISVANSGVSDYHPTRRKALVVTNMPQPTPIRPTPARPSREDCLDSWKEIADYLNRNVRTVQRWERLEDLPVSRHRHLKKGSVYALKSAIDEWRQNRQPLKTWIEAVEPAQQKRPRLAVLPFNNFSGNSIEDEYFADGLTEEMIARLCSAYSNELGVIARTSMMRYKGSQKNIAEIGAELRVEFILEGSVRRAGERLRIAAQLVRVGDQSHLWAESYNRSATDVLDIQTNVAEEIANALELQLLPNRKPIANAARTHNPAAYDAYLRGRFCLNRRTEPEFFRATEYFKRAVDIDPKFSLAYSGLADTYSTLGWYGVLTGKEAWERADQAARAALQLDPNSAEAHASLAFVLHSFAWDWESAEREYLRALELDRNYVLARWWYALFLAAMNRLPEAEQQMKSALALDPLSLVLNTYYGWILFFAHRYEDSCEQLLKTLDIEPHFLIAHFILGLVYSRMGQGARAVREFKLAREIGGDGTLALSGLARTSGRAGKKPEATRCLEKLRRLTDLQNVSAYHLACASIDCGNPDRACAELCQSIERRDCWSTLLQVDPVWEDLYDDKRFCEVIKLMKFPPSQRSYAALA